MIITGLIGYPVEHSISPVLFNYFAKKTKQEYAHIKLNISPKRNNLKNALLGLKALNMRGANITLPFKTEIIPFIEKLDQEAAEIGAVNTIVNRDNKFIGYNTDCIGAISAIEKGKKRVLGKRDKCLVFGTGGAARAVVYGLLKRNCLVKVAYRTPVSFRTKALKKQYGQKIEFVSLKDHIEEEIAWANIIINTTPCGMVPDVKSTVIDEKVFIKSSRISSFKEKLFFDAVFNPQETKFLKIGKKLGASTQGGLYMMIYQGVEAFKLWTGKRVKKEILPEALKLLLKSYEQK